MAGVIGAGVLIPAIQRPSRYTPAAFAGIVQGARAAIIAGIGVGDELAAGARVTGIVRAGVAILARKFIAANALSKVAVVTGGAEVTVVTGTDVEQMQASLCGVATVVSANIVIIAVEKAGIAAFSRLTRVANGTLVAVVAAIVVGQMHAKSVGTACIVRAWVAILTIHQLAWYALAVLTGVINGAWVAIITWPGVYFVAASGDRQATVCCARIVVAAVDLAATLALAVYAKVHGGALVSVVAR